MPRKRWDKVMRSFDWGISWIDHVFFKQQQQLGSIVWISLWWRTWSISPGAVHQFALGSEEVSWAGCLALRDYRGEQDICALRHRGTVHWMEGTHVTWIGGSSCKGFKRGAAVMGLGLREGKKHSRWKQERASGRKRPLKGQRGQTSCR